MSDMRKLMESLNKIETQPLDEAFGGMKVGEPTYSLYDKATNTFGYVDMGWLKNSPLPKKSASGSTAEEVKRKHIAMLSNFKKKLGPKPGRYLKEWESGMKELKAASRWVVVKIDVKEV